MDQVTRPRRRGNPTELLIDDSAIRISMVGFFDLLGFSNRVENAKTAGDFQTVAASIATIQHYFEHRSGDASVNALHRITGKKVLAFSDCVVTAVSAETRIAETEGLFDVLGSEIWDTRQPGHGRSIQDGERVGLLPRYRRI